MTTSLTTIVLGTAFLVAIACAVAHAFGIPVKESVIEVTACAYLVVHASSAKLKRKRAGTRRYRDPPSWKQDIEKAQTKKSVGRIRKNPVADASNSRP